MKFLRERLIDPESRSNNIRLTWLKEGAEADDITSFLKKTFQLILDLKDGNPLPEIDWAHQALRPKPDPGEPPSAIVVRLLRWGDRQTTLQASRKKQKLVWKGRWFFACQDLATEVQKQRAAYKDIIEKVNTTGLRFGLLHPVRFHDRIL